MIFQRRLVRVPRNGRGIGRLFSCTIPVRSPTAGYDWYNSHRGTYRSCTDPSIPLHDPSNPMKTILPNLIIFLPGFGGVHVGEWRVGDSCLPFSVTRSVDFGVSELDTWFRQLSPQRACSVLGHHLRLSKFGNSLSVWSFLNSMQ